MNRQQKHIFFRVSCIALLLFSGLIYTTQAEQGTLTLEIKGIGTRHGTPDNVNLGILHTSTSTQEVIGQFTGYFRVEDMQADITGHYTTIQCDGVYGPGGYKLTGVYLKAGNTTPTLIFGVTGNVFIAPELYDYASILNPMTYIYKPTLASNAGTANKYGDKPSLKIVIPGYTPPGSYSGTIVFSFYYY